MVSLFHVDKGNVDLLMDSTKDIYYLQYWMKP